MLCTGGEQATGFLRMAYAGENAVELVIAIGEEDMWGRGYGRLALSQAIGVAFFELHRERIIAHIYNENSRSRHLFVSRGFVPLSQGERLTEYQLTYDDFVAQRKRPESCIA